MRKPLLLLALIALVSASAVPRMVADVIFYNGDFKDKDLSCERNTYVTDSRVYENFHVTGTWQITNLWGHFHEIDTNSLDRAYYEIRQGISPGSGGTLISGGSINVTKEAVAQNVWGQTVYRIEGRLADLVLATGDYWITLAPEGYGRGQWWVFGSTGANAVGSTAFDGVSYWDSSFWYHTWIRLPNEGTSEGNWSFGVSGTPIPEPSSILALLCGIEGWGWVAWRRYRK